MVTFSIKLPTRFMLHIVVWYCRCFGLTVAYYTVIAVVVTNNIARIRVTTQTVYFTASDNQRCFTLMIFRITFVFVPLLLHCLG